MGLGSLIDLLFGEEQGTEVEVPADQPTTQQIPTTFRRSELCDPRWLEWSVSQRKDTLGVPSLYLKLPLKELSNLIEALFSVTTLMARTALVERESFDYLTRLREIHSFLREEEDRATNPSVFWSISLEDARKDILALDFVGTFSSKSGKSLDRTGLLAKFKRVLEAGIERNPDFDWIRRMGGLSDEQYDTRRRSLQDLAQLEPESE